MMHVDRGGFLPRYHDEMQLRSPFAIDTKGGDCWLIVIDDKLVTYLMTTTPLQRIRYLEWCWACVTLAVVTMCLGDVLPGDMPVDVFGGALAWDGGGHVVHLWWFAPWYIEPMTQSIWSMMWMPMPCLDESFSTHAKGPCSLIAWW